MASKYLAALSEQGRADVLAKLHGIQNGECFICEQPIDLVLHVNSLDIDHVVPLANGGKDHADNLALAHARCNRSKQAADLRVARVLARFDRIATSADVAGRAADLGDLLAEFGGSKHALTFTAGGDQFRWTQSEIGDPAERRTPIWTDPLSKDRYCFVNLSIEFLHHDRTINPRPIGKNIRGLIEEFQVGRPQLHAALAWLDTTTGTATVELFDGQHKAAAQILLGVRSLPVRIFLDPDRPRLLKTNTNAGTKLRQVAFDMSVQRRLGNALFADRVARYRSDRGLDEDDFAFSEKDLVSHFKGESHEVKRYVIDAIRNAVTTDPSNRLMAFVESGGRSPDKPLSYSTIEKTFLSFFICPELLATPIVGNDGNGPRDNEVAQLVRLMNVVAETILVDSWDTGLGTAKIEDKVKKDEDVPEPHLRAFRLTRENIVWAWLKYVSKIIDNYMVNTAGNSPDADRLFHAPLPEPLWERINAFIANLVLLPVWVNRALSATVFGGKPTNAYWETILKTGRTPDGVSVLVNPIDIREMIKDAPA